MKLDIDINIPEPQQHDILEQIARALKHAKVSVNINLKLDRI